MREPWVNSGSAAHEIDCQFSQERHRKNSTANLVRPLFGPIAKAIWPYKTAAFLAEFSGTSERTTARWISGEIDAPAIVYAKLWLKIIESGKPPSQGG
jgi:hypothetical protein